MPCKNCGGDVIILMRVMPICDDCYRKYARWIKIAIEQINAVVFYSRTQNKWISYPFYPHITGVYDTFKELAINCYYLPDDIEFEGLTIRYKEVESDVIVPNYGKLVHTFNNEMDRTALTKKSTFKIIWSPSAHRHLSRNRQSRARTILMALSGRFPLKVIHRILRAVV